MTVFGAGSALLIAPQASWGTKNVTIADMRPFNVIDVDYTQTPDRSESASISPSQGFTQAFRYGTIAADGSFNIEVPYEGAGILWEALLGQAAAPVGPVDGIYTHTYTPDTTLPILTLVKMTGDVWEEVIQGAKVGKAMLSYAVNQGLQCGFTFIAEKSPDGRVTPRTITWTVPNPAIVVFGEIATSFTWASISLCPNKIDIEIDNKLEARFCALSRYTQEPNFSGSKRTVRVSMEFDLEDMDAYNAFIAATEGDMSFVWTDGTNTLQIDIDDAEMLTYSDPVKGNGVITAKATWGGKAKTSGDQAITIIAKNAQSTSTEKA